MIGSDNEANAEANAEGFVWIRKLNILTNVMSLATSCPEIKAVLDVKAGIAINFIQLACIENSILFGFANGNIYAGTNVELPPDLAIKNKYAIHKPIFNFFINDYFSGTCMSDLYVYQMIITIIHQFIGVEAPIIIPSAQFIWKYNGRDFSASFINKLSNNKTTINMGEITSAITFVDNINRAYDVALPPITFANHIDNVFAKPFVIIKSLNSNVCNMIDSMNEMRASCPLMREGRLSYDVCN